MPVLIGTTLNFVLIAAVLAFGVVEWSEPPESSGPSNPSWEFVSFAVLCGATSFATIEALKRLLLLRGRFQLRETERWINVRLVWLGRPTNTKDAVRQMHAGLGVAPGGAIRTFNLPSEQLAALVSAAADELLVARRRRSLLEALSLVPRHEIESAWERAEEHRHYATREREFPPDPVLETLPHRVRTGVDQLQITLAERWRLFVQSAAVWVAGAYGLALAGGAGFEGLNKGKLVLAAVILGGPLAWIFRDLAAVIESHRR